ncbi:metabotropic glycine receptor-like [Tubulanus polymorphus]|uniref:metabotropic glycine receptor-like n=1 Tax=Tubulanus polymorphus TaxID=672921 RepID=UPI003DA25726
MEPYDLSLMLSVLVALSAQLLAAVDEGLTTGHLARSIRYSVDSGRSIQPLTSLSRRDLPKNELPSREDIQNLIKKDAVFAALELIEETKDLNNEKNCTRTSLNHFINDHHYKFPSSSQVKQFTRQMENAVKTANLLGSVFQSVKSVKSNNNVYNNGFYYSIVRSNCESDSTLFGCSIAFALHKYNGMKSFCPYAYRDKGSGQIIVKDLSRNLYYAHNRTTGCDWFTKQREKDFSYLYKKHNVSFPVLEDDARKRINNVSLIMASKDEGYWSLPYFDCRHGSTWLITYSVPFFGTNKEFMGVVGVDIDLKKLDINQCANDGGLFANTHRCREETTQCVPIPGQGFHRGSYRCECKKGFYFPPAAPVNKYFNGSQVEAAYILTILTNKKHDELEYNTEFQCLPCNGCESCTDGTPCYVQYDVMLRGIPLGIQSFCMTITLVLGIIIVRLRKTRVMKSSMWILLEIILIGALLLYSTVVIQYFEPNTQTCLLIPWFRECGFAVVYGALILKVYRVLAEFQSRKAHRVHVRDRDLLKYLLGIVLIVIGYMSAWTAVNMDHVREGVNLLTTGETSDKIKFRICKSHWWDYVIEFGEFLFLVLGIYLCYCVRSAPSEYLETKFISWAIYNETVISGLLHIIRHFVWLHVNPDFTFLMYFIRCQLTVSTTLILVLGPKLWFAHRPPSEDQIRNRAYSTSDVHDTILPESMKLHVGVSSNGDVDVGEINLSEMDPEDIRAELKRLYTQLQIYKTKTMRKDNPHISKRRGGRKQTHRRFSLQPFHKHRHHHHEEHEHELSKTPEESTNSAEGVAITLDSANKADEVHNLPSVTFKSGHK